jgi:hypothetical protein
MNLNERPLTPALFNLRISAPCGTMSNAFLRSIKPRKHLPCLFRVLLAISYNATIWAAHSSRLLKPVCSTASLFSRSNSPRMRRFNTVQRTLRVVGTFLHSISKWTGFLIWQMQHDILLSEWIRHCQSRRQINSVEAAIRALLTPF